MRQENRGRSQNSRARTRAGAPWLLLWKFWPRAESGLQGPGCHLSFSEQWNCITCNDLWVSRPHHFSYLHALTTGHTVFRPSSVARPFTSRHHSVGLLLSPWIARGFVCLSLMSLTTLSFHPWSSEEARELPYSGVGPTSVYACVPLAQIRCFRTPKNQTPGPYSEAVP